MTRAAWLERHDEFEGVGAHELNWRYDHVDGGDWDSALRDLAEISRKKTPALARAQGFLSLVPVRFDGADISHHQDDAGPIDWPTLRSVSAWVATKATQSTTYVDPTCETHRAQMGAQAFTRRGLYHWLSHTTSPTAQARHFLNCVGTLHVGEFVMLDAEEGGITAAMCLEWLTAVEAVTRRPGSVYSGAYVAGGTIWQSTEIRRSPYGSRPMHLAAYTSEAKAKALPGVAAYPWSAWQYSSNGPVPGVTGRCDMNRVDVMAHYDLAAGVPPPTPSEDVMDIRLLVLTNSDAQFLAETTSDGRALRCRWADGSAKTQAVVAAHRSAATGKQSTFQQSGDVAGLANVYLDGPLPVGDSKHTWTGDEFAGFDQLTAPNTLEPRVAKVEGVVDKLNEAVGRNGQEIHEVKTNLVKAGGG